MYINAGFDDYLTKPIDTGKLESMLLKYLPTDLVEKAENDTEEEKSQQAPERSILVVADDVEFLRKVREWLTDQYNVVVVKSGQQALAYLKKHEAELILMDSGLQEQDGLDKTKLIRDNFKDMSQDEITSQVNKFFGEGC